MTLLSTVSVYPQTTLPALTSSGLTITVPEFSIGSFHYSGGSIETLPNCTQYLTLNLKTQKLHTLSRAISDGDLVLARLIATATEITQINPQPLTLPTTRIPRALAKIDTHQPLTISCFGSSLVAGGAGEKGWQKRLFNDQYPEADLRVGSNFKVTSHGVGGTNARFSASLFGTALNHGKTYTTSAYNCELAIVALLPNGGEDREAVFEGVVRMLRARDIEVLLLTDNSFAGKGENTPLWTGGDFVRKMADRYGCGIADTAAYMLEAERRGTKVFVDVIHSTPEGQREWAEAISGALIPQFTTPPTASADTVNAAQSDQTLEPQGKVPGIIEVDLSPQHQGGIEVAKAPGSKFNSMFSAPDATRLDLSTGDTLEVSHKSMQAADLIFDASSDFTADICDATGATILKAITYKAPPKVVSRPQTHSVFPASVLKTIEDRTYQIKVTSGTLRLYGVSYHLPK